MIKEVQKNDIEFCSNSDFDFCLRLGQAKEQKIALMYMNDKFEVKSQSKAHLKKTFLVEYICWGKPSGISITRSDEYILNFSGLNDEVQITIKTDRLKRLVRKIYDEDPINNVLDLSKNPNNGGVLIKVPLHRLFQEI